MNPKEKTCENKDAYEKLVEDWTRATPEEKRQIEIGNLGYPITPKPVADKSQD